MILVFPGGYFDFRLIYFFSPQKEKIKKDSLIVRHKLWPHISVRGEKLDLVEQQYCAPPCFCNEIEAGTSYFWSSLSATWWLLKISHMCWKTNCYARYVMGRNRVTCRFFEPKFVHGILIFSGGWPLKFLFNFKKHITVYSNSYLWALSNLELPKS